MSIKHLIIIAFFLASFASIADEDPAVAIVDGVPIKQSTFEETYKQNKLFVSGKLVTKEKTLNDLINRQLGLQRAIKNKLDKNPIVKNKIDDVIYHAQVSKDLEPRLKKIVVTDNDVMSYYKSNPEYRTAHILFRMRAEPSKNETEAALTQALGVYKLLQEKPDLFPELASKYSQSSTAPNGGDMGFQPAVSLAPEFFAAINGKPDNYISPPIQTQFGFHIIKVIAKKDYKSINMPVYKKIVYDQKRDFILEQYFADLRKGKSIKIFEKYVK